MSTLFIAQIIAFLQILIEYISHKVQQHKSIFKSYKMLLLEAPPVKCCYNIWHAMLRMIVPNDMTSYWGMLWLIEMLLGHVVAADMRR